ncbi:unnamed protein product [Linum tenue]|uniref:FAD-binding PCMH-type domain-containing protein n=1 Tax=Linum tenue TaxID=586396 RepID=A0AAV0QJK7_9ROSI|nr:unnamed protein product [Linum tenue]
MTNKSSCLVSAIVSVLLVQLLFSPSSSLQPLAFDDSSVYETFLQCLESYLSPNDQISNLVFTSTNSSYTSVLQAYKRNARFNSDLKPLIIVTPTSIPHVQYAVLCTRRIGYRLRIRSGGHDFEGLSYVSDSPFFLIDMSNLRSIEVNIETNSAWVQSGAILGEVYHAIWEKSKVHGFPAGVCPTVAVGGHFSGGGATFSIGNPWGKASSGRSAVAAEPVLASSFLIRSSLSRSQKPSPFSRWRAIPMRVWRILSTGGSLLLRPLAMICS